jgi:hypothetical protein
MARQRTAVSVHAFSVNGNSVREHFHSFSVSGNSVRGRVMARSLLTATPSENPVNDNSVRGRVVARSLLTVTPSENFHSFSVNGNSVRGHCN